MFSSATIQAALQPCRHLGQPPLEHFRVAGSSCPEILGRSVSASNHACREKSDQAGSYAWTFVAPAATLVDASKKDVGKYYGGPTWESKDGSKVSGKQVAVSPATPGNLPLQLVKANQATGNGVMADLTYIQRLNTVGGIPPSQNCDRGNIGQEMKVSYQADYVFYTAR
ncbi:MAG: DUF3455 domain-containing protein [Betaproteobacteria bacterium]|nr:DUF3455 domain-containing protein [Betaproteobacteria bacterium]